MNNSFFSKLAPYEPKFYPLLKELAEVISEVADLIIECVSNYSYEVAVDYFKKIKELERKGDRISDKIFEELNSTFITPFDREDINSLANKLDDVTDFINSCAKRIVLYHPKRIPDSAKQLGILLKEAASHINKAVSELDDIKKDAKNIKAYCSELHKVENNADDVYENFLIDLFENEKDAIEVIKLKEIMHELERATDAAEDVGKIIKTIIIKYA